MTSITLSSTLETIYGNAITGCTSLTELNLPKTCVLKKLNDNSIQNLPLCSSTFKIPSTLTYLGGNVFSQCPKLVLTYEEGGQFKIACGVLSQNTVIKMFVGPSSNLNIPGNYTEFSRNALNSNAIETVTIASKITTLPPQLIWNSVNLKTFTASGVTVVENDCFRGCTSLHTVSLGKVTMLNWGAFLGCSSLVNVNIDFSALKTLSYQAFAECRQLSKFECSSTQLTTIDYKCFEKCLMLKSIIIPSHVTTINYNAFSLSGLKTLQFAGTAITVLGPRSFYQCQELDNIQLPTSITKLEKECFAMCSSLVNMVIPSNVVTIGELAFEGCSSLETLTIPGTSAMTLTAGAFIGCMNFRDIVIGEHPSFTYDKGIVLYDKAREEILVYLAGCTNREFIIPDSVVRVAAHAFDYAIHLETIVIPDSGKITQIGYRAFHYCKSLTRVTIPDSVTVVDQEAFLNTNIVKCGSVVYPLGLKDALIAAGINESCLYPCPPTDPFTNRMSREDMKMDIVRCAAGLIFSVINHI